MVPTHPDGFRTGFQTFVPIVWGLLGHFGFELVFVYVFVVKVDVFQHKTTCYPYIWSKAAQHELSNYHGSS